ncbi:MAG: lipase family protein [Gammaproteobacteria bacterium]
MTPDTSWNSLFKPGEATEYFKTSGLAAPAAIQIKTNRFNLSNAWWLAEASRLIYHPDFANDINISFGAFHFEQQAYIENTETSTHAALLKVTQEPACLIIVFRGSDEAEDWGINTQINQSDFTNKGKVHSGFKKAYLSIREDLFSELKNNSLPLFITGHSLGAALAALATSELYENKHFDSCYTFGSPRIGNSEFVNSVRSKSIYRIVNNSDIVTTIPIDFKTINYRHIGLSYLIDDKNTLKEGLSETDIYDFQKTKIKDLKSYALSKLFNKELFSRTLSHFSTVLFHATCRKRLTFCIR